MTLLGLTFTQLALIFGAVGGVVTVLYILKLRRRRVRVPFSKLWDRVLLEKESTSLFRRLKRLLSLLLQLLFLFLLTAALGDPRLTTEVLDGRHVILLLDTSASMKAIDGKGGRTRMEVALDEARSIVRGMNGADVLMVVRMDAQITPLSGFVSDEKRLLKVLKGVAASDTRADLLRALKFCGDSLRGRKNPLLILIGDGAYPDHLLGLVELDHTSGKKIVEKTKKPNGAPRAAKGSRAADKARARKGAKRRRVPAAALGGVSLRGITVRFLPVGQSRDNVGVVAFNARRYVRNKLSFEIFMEVVNYRKEATTVDLQLYSDGQLIDVQRLKLKGEETARYSCEPDERRRKRQAWCDLAATGEMLEARLVPPDKGKETPKTVDAFPLDDTAFALLPRRKKQKVLLVTKGNLFLEGAMLQQPNIELSRVEPTGYSETLARRFDALIFDGTYPAKPPPQHALLFNPPMKGSPIEVAGRIRAPMITDQDRKHPVMRWVTLKDVNIANSARFKVEPGMDVLAASFKQPVMVASTRGPKKVVAFGFDLTRSDLPLRVAFPILILNTLDWFAGDSEELLTSYRTGETWSVPLPDPSVSAEQGVRVTRPDGTTVTAPVNDGRALVHGVQAGVYRLRARDKTSQLAANLADPVESRIKPRSELVLGGRTLTRPTGFGIALRREIWIYLLLIAVALTLLEWLTYNRRVTV
jgi:hypothetical protein